MRNWTFGAKALSIRPPATITPLKTVTGRAPKLSTQALQTGPAERTKDRRREDGVQLSCPTCCCSAVFFLIFNRPYQLIVNGHTPFKTGAISQILFLPQMAESCSISCYRTIGHVV